MAVAVGACMRFFFDAGALTLFAAGAALVAACGSNEGMTTGAGGGGGPSSGGNGGAPTTESAGPTGSGGNGGNGGGNGGSGAAAGNGGTGAGGDCASDQIVGEGEPLAAIGPCGKLEYRTYKNRDQAEAVNRLPDFSYAGYGHGGVAIPDDVPVVAEVSPVAGDDRASLQAAIEEASAKPLGANGFRGAVLIHKGNYEVGDTLTVEADGVVLRGEGQGADGTVITATAAKQYTLIEARGGGSGFGEVAGSRTDISTGVVPVGARSFEVESAAGYAVGDTIVVLRTPNQTWIDELGMEPFGWTADSYQIANERTITAVDGNLLTIDIPIIDTIESHYGGGVVYRSQVKGRLRHAGIEDLRLDSKYASATDENHGWTAVRLSRAEDSWVRRVTVLHFGLNAVTLADQSVFNTVEDVAHLDPISQITGGRRYPFNIDKGTGNLFQRCFTRNGRHNFVTGARVAGPNVWLDCLAEDSHADDGPHHRWSTGLLFDNTKGAELKVQNRQESGTGHGWAGAQVLFWNADHGILICDAPKGAMNWAIGCVGQKKEGNWAPEEPEGWWESAGTAVAPRSLYLQQLEDRLGPKAALAVTVVPQRTGRIWDSLNAWAGEGKLSDFLN